MRKAIAPLSYLGRQNFDQIYLSRSQNCHPTKMSHLRHAMVCASNVNRSMAAHELIKAEGLDVRFSLVNTSLPPT